MTGFPTPGRACSAPTCASRNPPRTIKTVTTFRLLRQTNCFSRFALVTGEVAPSGRSDVEVTAVAVDEYRRKLSRAFGGLCLDSSRRRG